MANETTILITEAARKSWNLMISDISRFVRAREIDPLLSKIKQLTADNKYLEKSVFHGDATSAKWRKECIMRFALNTIYEAEIRRLCRSLDKTDKDYYDLMDDLDVEARRLCASDEFEHQVSMLEISLIGTDLKDNNKAPQAEETDAAQGI